MSTRPARSSGRARGGRGGAEPRARIVEREEQVWARLVCGESQRTIAHALGISQPAVSKILRRLLDRHDAAAAADRARHDALIRARLNFLYAENVRAFRRSEEDDVCKTQRRIQGPGGTLLREVHELRARKRAGDARFLQEAREALMAQLDVPKLPDVPTQEALDLSRLTPDELATLHELRRKMQAANPKDPRQSGGES